MPSTEIQYSNSVINYIQGNQYNYEYNDRENGPGHAFPVRTKLLQFLRPAGFPVYYPSPRLPNTCAWTLSHDLVGSWLDHDIPRLWLYGGPGTGKSVLAAYLVEHKKKTVSYSKDEIVLSFFCKERGSTKQRVAHIIMGLIRDCIDRQDRPYEKLVADELEVMFLSERKDYEFTVDQLKPHLVSFLKPFKQIWVIVDALDECEDPVALVDILSCLPLTSSMKILLLCRNERAIGHRLRHWTGVEVGGKGTTEEDMRTFVRKEVKSLVSDFPLLRSQADELEKGLFDSAGDMFLYVRLKCETIRDLNPSTKSVAKETLATLKRSPHNLEQLYEKYISQRLERNTERQNQIAVRTLQWIVYSPRPVTSTLLTSVLAVDIDDDQGVLGDDLDHDIVRTVDNALGILVEWRETGSGVLHAQLVHLSFRDYLFHLRQLPFGQSRPLPPYDSIRADACHDVLVKTCRIVLDAPPVMAAIHQFYNSVDERWQSRPQRQGRLRKQLYKGMHWSHWEHKQLKDLDRERDWLEEEVHRIEADVDEFGKDLGREWVESTKERLKILYGAPVKQAECLQRLRAVTNLRERELMMYAFGEFTYHLIRVDDPFLVITKSISELGRQINTSILIILKEVSSCSAIPISARTGLNNVLRLLEETVTLAGILSRANQELSPWKWYWVFICGIMRSNLWRHIYFIRSIRTNDLWSDGILQLLGASPQPTNMQYLFVLVTQSLVNLREIESVICAFDEEVRVVTGMGFLIYLLQRYRQVLAQFTILKIFGDTEDGRRLLLEDDFQYPKLLVDPSKRTYTNDEQVDIRVKRRQFSVSHTILLGFFIALSVSFSIASSQVFHLS